MSISLRKSTVTGLEAVCSFTQDVLMMAGLSLLLGILSLVIKQPEAHAWNGPAIVAAVPTTQTTQTTQSLQASQPLHTQESDELFPETRGATLKPHLIGVLEYVKQRYRVSAEAVLPVFQVAELIGRERRIDPLLILAIIGVESGFDPRAESEMGARGLMQVIPRFHMDKLPSGFRSKHFFDPEVNIRVGVGVLEEALKRRGVLTAALQSYSGSSDRVGGYSNKVLAEKARLEKASRGAIALLPSA